MNDELQAANAAMSVPSPVQLEVAVEEARPRLAEEQLAYASLLDTGMKVGLLLLVLTFVTYTTGLLAPHVPLDDLPRYWSMPVRQYLAATGIHPGWGWLQRLGQGDFLNFAGIAFLAGVTIACYAAIIPIFLRRKERIYATLAVLEVAVLALAASGVLGGGGH